MPCVVKAKLQFSTPRTICSTAIVHMVVKGRACLGDKVASCSTAQICMVVNASGTGVLYANG